MSRLAIVTAFGAEYQAIWSALADPKILVEKDKAGYAAVEGRLFDSSVMLMVSGMGKERVQQHFSDLVSRFSPSCALSLGFCGGLSFSSRVGTISVPDTVQDLNRKTLSPTLSLRQRISKKLYDEDLEFLVGSMVTTDKIVETAEERKKINSSTGAVTVDMEAYYFAEICEAKGLPWFVLKTVMDDLETKSFNRDDLKPGLKTAEKELLRILPIVMTEVKAEWGL
jgi:nucleoside phosphorylase